MICIEAVIRPERIAQVTSALDAAGCPGFYYYNVTGQGRQRGVEVFVGRAGQLLTKMIQSIQLQRNDVYICNVVKCRPPENRIPSEDEVATCSPFLFRQLSVLRPKLICCLGLTATQTILKVKGSLGRLRNKIHTFQDIQVIATYHPAYLLRNPSAKKEAWEDLKKIRSMLNQ